MAWSDQLRLLISPDDIVFVRLARGARVRAVAKGTVSVSREDAHPAWQRVVNALVAHRQEFGERAAEVTVILSNHFVHYAVVPWEAEGAPAASWEAHVRRRLQEKHGETRDEWSIRADRPVPGRSTLACAIDAAFLRALGAQLDRRPLRLVSVQPLLMAAFNEFRSVLGRAGCFVVYERGALWSGTYAAGEWHAVDKHPITVDASAIAELDRQCAFATARGAKTFFLCVAEQDHVVPAMDEASALRILKPPQRVGAAFGNALLGAGR